MRAEQKMKSSTHPQQLSLQQRLPCCCLYELLACYLLLLTRDIEMGEGDRAGADVGGHIGGR